MDKNAPRFAAGHLDLEGGTGGITGMCSCGEFLEVYKIDKTFRVQCPESLDPEVTNPNMPWIVQDVADVGSGHIVVARVLLQNRELLNSALLPRHIDKDSIVVLLHELKELLLTCDKVAYQLGSEITAIIDKIEQENIPRDNRGRALNPFPQVAQLEDHATIFLTNAKRFAQLLAEIFNSFFGTEFHGPHFHKIKHWVQSNLTVNAPLYKLVDENEPPIKYYIDLRNFQEHPREDKRTVVENFRLLPDLSIRCPAWYITGNPPAPIAEEMHEIARFLLRFTEVFLVHCIFQSMEGKIPYYVVAIPNEKRRKECPIKYELQVDMSRLGNT